MTAPTSRPGPEPAVGAPGEGAGAETPLVGVGAEEIFEATAVLPTAGGPAVGTEMLPIDELGHVLHGEPEAAERLLAGLRRAGPLAVAGLVSNGANVLMTVVVARLLTQGGYGELAALLSLFLVLSMPGSAVLVGVVRRVTAWRQTGSTGRVDDWARRVHRFALGAVVALAVATLFAQHEIASLMHLPSAGGVLPVLTAGGVWVLLSVDRGLLQAHRAYRPLGANLIVEGGLRTVLTIALTGVGFGVTGAAYALLLAEVSAATHARVMAGRVRRGGSGAAAPGDGDAGVAVVHSRRHLALDVGAALGCLSLLAVLQNLDVILVEHFRPGRSGPYAAISVASKALVFGAIVLGSYLLPEATIRWQRGHHALRQLAVTGVILAVPAAALVTLGLAAPTLVLRVAFGAKLDGDAPALATLAAAMVCLCVTVVLTNYLLGTGWRWVALLLVAGGAVAVPAMFVAHGAPVPTARADLAVQAGLMVAVGVAFVLVHVSGKRLRVH